MIKIIHIFAFLKIIPVQKQNFSQFHQWSLPSLAAFIIWFLVPGLLVALHELNMAVENIDERQSLSALMNFAFYFILFNMGFILLAGPQLLGILLRRCSSLFDLDLLSMPRRQWMIWVSTPMPAIAILISSIPYALNHMKGDSLISQALSFVLKVVPITVLAAMSSIVMTSMLLIMSSVLTHMIACFKELKSFNDNTDLVWSTCDIYHDVCNQLGPFFMLLFATLCSTVMIMAFILYEYINNFVIVCYCCLFILTGTLILLHLALIADDCEEAITDLRLHFRQASSNSTANKIKQRVTKGREPEVGKMTTFDL
jgi:hypothetical protein